MPTLRPRPFRSAALIAAAAALMLPGSLACAQQRVGGGTALDANAQVGGGNANPNAVVPDFRARNLLITGQVTDGRQFRGDVGYSAAGAFQGSLGSDDLFRFRADSYGSTRQLSQVNTLGNAGLNASSNDLAGGNIIYSGFFNPGVGEVNTPGTVRTVINSDGTRSASVTAGSTFNTEFVGAPRLANATIGAGSVAANDRTLGLSRNADGNVTRVEASPVFGLRETPFQIDGPTPPDDADDPAGNRNNNQPNDANDARLGGQLGDARFGTGFTPDASRDPADPTQPNARATDRTSINSNANNNDARRGNTLDTQRSTGRLGENATNLASNSAVDPDAPRDPLTGLPASIQLGARLTPGLINNNARPAEIDEQDAQRVTRLGEAIFRPLDTTAAQPGDSAYLDQLAKIREEYRRGNQAREDGQDPDQAPRDPLAGPVKPAWMDRLETPEDQLIQRAEESGLNAVAAILRTQRDNNAENDIQTANDPESQRTLAAMESLLDQLSYDLPRLETLQGNRADRVNAGFKRAEEAMAQGKFFDATAAYRQLTIDAPGNPLARVGQIHAQMGAGMIRSASLHLRRLFEDHPELIATRYAANLLPSEERTVWLRDELQKAIDAPDQNNYEPAVMLAYLGHQVESRQLVRYGLALATEAAPLDPLVPLLKKVWLDEDGQ